MYVRLRAPTPILIMIVLLLSSLAVQADVLVLKNGDRITGEIKRIWDDEITIEPEYSDEFQVDIPAVEHIESDHEFEIELADGTSLLARFSGAGADGRQTMMSAEKSVSVPLAQLFEVDEPPDEFDWEGHIDFSATVNGGNTDTSNTKLRADITVEIPKHRNIGELTFYREELDGLSTKEQDLLRYSYNWLFNDPWFLGAVLSYKRDPIIELDSRIVASAGIGLDVWNTPRRKLSLQLGAGYQVEEIGQESEDSAVATWTLRYRQDFFSDDLELFHNQSIIHNLSGRTNTSYKTSTGLRYEITDLLYASASFDFDYETDPVDLVKHEDLVLVLGLGLEL